MTRDEVLSLLARRRAAIAQRDDRALAALYADANRLESPIAGLAVGREAAIRATWAFFEAFPDVTIDEDIFAIDDDRIALVAHIGGTHTGEIMGLPPSGGFLAKWLLLGTAVVSGQWWWAATMLVGGLLTAGYMFLILSRAMTAAHEPVKLQTSIPHYPQAAALALALCSLLLGFVAFGSFDTVQIGRPAAPQVGLR